MAKAKLSVSLDLNRLGALMILREEGGDRFMAAQLDIQDYKAVSGALKGEITAAPTPYTMMRDIIAKLDATVEEVIINELTHGAYLARVVLRKDGQTIIVDRLRPTDVVMLALLTKCLIFTETNVLEETKVRSEEEIGDTQPAWFAHAGLGELTKH